MDFEMPQRSDPVLSLSKRLENSTKTTQIRLENGSKIAQNDTKSRRKRLTFDFVFLMRLINHFVD